MPHLKSSQQGYFMKKKLLPAQIIVIGFVSIITIGTLLLTLPIASSAKTFTSPIDAAFTAVSATCVTGLVTLTTAEHWSFFGQAIILLMIQIGGLGFMSIASAISTLVRRSITPKERILISQAFGLSTNEGMVVLVNRVIKRTFIIESIGALLLFIEFVQHTEYNILMQIWLSIFHSISAFCNAGFDIIGASSLVPLQNSYILQITLSILIFSGGIGFIVWDDIADYIKTKDRLSVYTKFVLIVSLILIFAGSVFTMASEWNNPSTIGNLSAPQKIMTSITHSISLRTAGFAIFPNANMNGFCYFVSVLLMFIGGASCSTAGGIKVGTFGVIIYSVFKFATGHNDVILFKRTINHATVMRAFTLLILGVVLITMCVGCLALLNPNIEIDAIIYEVTSAFGTVGISFGITPALTIASKIILMILMFFGRVGILTVTFSLLYRSAQDDSNVKRPEAMMLIG